MLTKGISVVFWKWGWGWENYWEGSQLELLWLWRYLDIDYSHYYIHAYILWVYFMSVNLISNLIKNNMENDAIALSLVIRIWNNIKFGLIIYSKDTYPYLHRVKSKRKEFRTKYFKLFWISGRIWTIPFSVKIFLFLGFYNKWFWFHNLK